MTSEQRLNQHVCEDDFAHAAVERAQGSACPRPRAAAAVSACLVSSSGTSAGARRPWRRPWRSRLRQHRRLRLHCRLLRRGQSRGKGWWGSAFGEGDRFVAQPIAHAVFRPPWRFRLEASQSFCSKRGWGRIVSGEVLTCFVSLGTGVSVRPTDPPTDQAYALAGPLFGVGLRLRTLSRRRRLQEGCRA